MYRYGFGAAIFGAALVSHPAMAQSDYLDSIADAVGDASAQGQLSLGKGEYRATVGDIRAVVKIPANMQSTMHFAILNRTLVSGEWAFKQPIEVTLRQGGKCVHLFIKRLKYDRGGELSPDDSDTTMAPVPGLPGGCNDSEPLLALREILNLTADISSFLKGSVYVAADHMVRCVNAACSQTDKVLPIRAVKLYGEGTAANPTPAFNVVFRDGSTVMLPKEGFLKLGQGSQAQFDSLDYNLETSKGSAELSKLALVADDGVISGGTTLFRLSAGTKVQLEKLRINKASDSFAILNGSVSGHVGEGTTIVLSADQGKVSSLLFSSADIMLAGLSLTAAPNGETVMKAQRGTFQANLKNADLWFTDMTNLRLGYSTINFALGCPDGADPATCAPLEWSAGKVAVKGVINEFATSIDGGSFPLSDAGTTLIKRGKVQTGALQVDSSKPISPVTGLIKAFEIEFEAENLLLDRKTTIRSAHVGLSSQNLQFLPDEALPAGTLDLSGTVTRVEGGMLGSVGTIDGNLKMRIVRKPADAPEVVDGELTAKTKVLLQGDNYADGTLEVKGFRYYRGHGNAKLRLSIDKASYVWYTPSGSTSNSIAGVGSADVDVRSVPITVSMNQPFVVGPVDMESSGSDWKLAEMKDMDLSLAVAVPNDRLVDGSVKLAGLQVCSPSATLNGQTSILSAKVDLFASSAGGNVSIRDANISAPIGLNVKDGGCGAFATLVCGAIGSVAGPIGSVALGAVCGQAVADKEKDLEREFAQTSVDEVRKFRFGYDF